MDDKAFFKVSYGLYIISAQADGKASGCVANTLQQVTAFPERLSITLNKDNFTEQLIEKSGTFNGVVLSENVDMETIKKFGFQSGKDIDKFEGMQIQKDSQSIPYLVDHVCARFTCKVTGKLDIGTHVLFVGDVIEAELVGNEPVMTYSHYHEVKNGGTPKNAPSYHANSEKKGWRCSVCGYIYEGEVLPEDYICPLCGAPASVFEKL